MSLPISIHKILSIIALLLDQHRRSTSGKNLNKKFQYKNYLHRLSMVELNQFEKLLSERVLSNRISQTL